MTKLVSMKMTAEAREKMTEPAPAKADPPRYPWGLSLNLDDDTLTKLGIDKLPEAGVTMTLAAVVKVTTSEKRETEGGGKSRSISLQITDMALEAAGSKKSNAEALFGGGAK